MIAVIFETFPKQEKYQEYLDIAQELKPFLSQIDGFISIERFKEVAKVMRNYSMEARIQAPSDSKSEHGGQ